MNKDRRKQLAAVLPLLKDISDRIEKAAALVEAVHDEEEEVYENLSEGRQNGELGEAMQNAISEMSNGLDMLRSLEIKEISNILAEIAEAAEEEIPAAKVSEEELEARRMARLPQWVKDRLAVAEANVENANQELANAFGEADENDLTQILADDFVTPLKGKVIPAKQIIFNGYGIRISAEQNGSGINVTTVGFGTLMVLPRAGNTILIRAESRG